MKILITGTDGFIGKSLVELLNKEKYEIISLNRSDLNLLNLDEVKDFFDENKNVDFVIHTASIGGKRWDDDNPKVFYENTKMFENLLLFKTRYKAMITFGSGAEFGYPPHNTNEDNLNEGFTLNYYGLAKKYITNKVRKQNLDVIILRLFGCFGKYEHSQRFIKSNIVRNKNNHPMIIHQNRWMDFFYINDLVSVIDYALENYQKLKGKDYNITYKDKHTLKEICNYINEISYFKSDILIDNNEINSSYTGNSNKILESIKLIGLKEGIKQMFNEI